MTGPKRRQIGWKANSTLLAIFGLLTFSVASTIYVQQFGSRHGGLLQQLLVGIELLGLLGVGVMAYYMRSHVLRPLQTLTRDAEAVADGDLRRDIASVEREDEIGTLTRSVCAMRDRLLDVVEDAKVFERAVEETGHSVIITDDEEGIEYVNPAFERITGYTRAEALGKTPRILKSGETDPAVYEEMWETLQDGASWEGELVNRRKTGERQYVQQTIAPIEGDDGSIEHYVSIGTEITDHKLRKQVLEVYNRVLRHNLRNRVNVVTGNAGLISDGLADDVAAAAAEIRQATAQTDSDVPDEVDAATADLEAAAATIRRHAGTVVDAGERLEALNEKASLADHITRFGEHEEHHTPLSERLRAEVETARDANPHASIDLSLPDAEPIACKQSMQTALGELIDNAVEHNPAAAPSVDVGLNVQSQRAVVTVADDGPGIPEYERAVLRRGEETPLAHGSGLGLWLVYWVVTMNGGRLEIRDNDPQGTVVKIVLPLPRDRTDEQSRAPEAVAADD